MISLTSRYSDLEWKCIAQHRRRPRRQKDWTLYSEGLKKMGGERRIWKEMALRSSQWVADIRKQLDDAVVQGNLCCEKKTRGVQNLVHPGGISIGIDCISPLENYSSWAEYCNNWTQGRKTGKPVQKNAYWLPFKRLRIARERDVRQ